jgi:hypothetical protein
MLVSLKELAASLGASYSPRAASYVLPPCRTEELRSEIAALLRTLQAKRPVERDSQLPRLENLANECCGNLLLPDSKRDAGVTPKKHQRSTRETQTGSHLLLQNTRTQNIPSPHPPAHLDEAQKPKDLPCEYGPDKLLKSTRSAFIGVIDEMRDHLLDTSRPPNPRFANGAADWNIFGFDSLAVEAAEWRGEALSLALSATDPAAARRGLEKYQRKWESSLRKWFDCEISVEWKPAQRKW